jgi:hypothetical protein
MGSVEPAEQGVASGANSALREVGGALGVAVLTSVFTAHGDYTTPVRFAHGLVPAVWTGAAVIAAAAVAVLFVPARGGAGTERVTGAAEPVLATSP